MTATTLGTPTGKQVKTYYNSGTRASPVWNLITGLSKEKFDFGKPNFFQTEDRELEFKIQQAQADDPAKLTATYRRIRGAADSVWTALLAASEVSGTEIEFAVSDDAIANTGGINFARFFGKVAVISQDRDVGKFVETEIQIDEVEHYESNALCPLLIDQTIP